MTPRAPKSPIVCECLRVCEDQILKAIATRKIKSVADIIDYTQAGDGCTACHPLLKDYLEKARSPQT